MGSSSPIFGVKIPKSIWNQYQVIQAVTFSSPSWRSPTTFERATFSPSQKGHFESPGT